jgi:hypothetical protein
MGLGNGGRGLFKSGESFMKKNIAIMTVFFFFLASQPLLVFSQLEAVSGKVREIKPKGAGLFELVIDAGGNALTVLMNDGTLIEATAPAKTVRKGQRILQSAPGGGGGGVNAKMPKLPFQDMSAKQKKMMGLPDLGALPEMPDKLELPKKPEVPQMPKIPAVPKAPKGGKGVTEVKKGERAPEEGLGQEGAASGEDQGKARKKQEFETVEPEKDSLSKLIPSALTQPTAETLKDSVKKVVDIKQGDKGLTLVVESADGTKQEIATGPNAPVQQILSAGDLKAGMGVRLEVAESPEGKRAVRIIVL